MQQEVSQLFPTQKNVLYNILKVPQNLMRETPRKWIIRYKKMQKKNAKNHHLLQQEVSQLFPTQKSVLYNILKVPQNLIRGTPRKWVQKNAKKKAKNHHLLQ